MKFLKNLCTVAVIALLTLGTASAQFLQKPATGEAFTNVVAAYLITASSLTNLTTPTNQATIQISPNQGLAFQVKFAAAGAGSNPLRFTFNTSVDGTNYTTGNPIEFFTAPNGTTGVIDWTNFPATALNNVRYMRLTSISNTTAQVIQITNATWSVFR